MHTRCATIVDCVLVGHELATHAIAGVVRTRLPGISASLQKSFVLLVKLVVKISAVVCETTV